VGRVQVPAPRQPVQQVARRVLDGAAGQHQRPAGLVQLVDQRPLLFQQGLQPGQPLLVVRAGRGDLGRVDHVGFEGLADVAGMLDLVLHPLAGLGQQHARRIGMAVLLQVIGDPDGQRRRAAGRDAVLEAVPNSATMSGEIGAPFRPAFSAIATSSLA